METFTKCISPWLQQRQQILITLNDLAGVLPQRINQNQLSLTTFFQLLIDYVCAGHLQIFNLLLQQNHFNLLNTKEILQKINLTTNYIIKYNYKFNRFKNISANDIIKLLEQFANRIELEDLLLNTKSVKIHKKYIN